MASSIYFPAKTFTRLLSFVCFCMLSICFANNCMAQKKPGKLTGKIADSSTNQTLAGVSIALKGSARGVASITGGTYILTLPEGVYTIRYSYTGYATKEITELEVKSGETTYMNILLSPKASELEGVVIRSVSAKKESQSAVYNKQRLSAAASDGISQEQISKAPDNNAGQILKRVTGVSVQNDKFVVVRGLGAQYNQTVLNGVAMTSTETNQNAFSFDLIPSAAIDNITVNKTATPDLPGNFAGGIVQVNTKDFPANNFFSIALQTGFSDKTYGKDFYSSQRGKANWLSFGGSSLDLPAEFPKANDRVTYPDLNPQEVARRSKFLQNNLVPINYGASGKSLPNLNENIQLGIGKTIKFLNSSQFGIVAAVTQRKTELIEQETTARDATVQELNPDKTPIGEFGYYSKNTRYKYTGELAGVLNLAYSFGNNKITLKSLYSRVLKNNYIQRDSVLINENTITSGGQGFTFISEERTLSNSVLAGEHKIGKNKETQLDWNVNVTANKSNSPDIRNFVFSVDSINGQAIYSPDNSGISLPNYLKFRSRVWLDSKDLITGGAFNLSSVYHLFGVKQIIKGGILFQNRRRVGTSTVLAYENIPADIVDSLLATSHYYPGGMELNTAGTGITSGAGNFLANTSLQAAYESMENRIGKYMRIIWGIRFENYQQSVNVYDLFYYPNFPAPEYQLAPNKFATRTNFDFLPSVNIIYSPVKSINVRGAFSKTVIRPDLKDLAAFYRYDFDIFQFTTGNADLKSTNIANYDLKFEWFPSSGEIISFGAFYKKLTDPIEYGENAAPNVYIGKLAINTGDAYMRGLEAEFRKKLNFIGFAPWLKNISLFGNGSILSSKVKERIIYNRYFGFSSEHRLTGQPEYILNAGLSVAAFKNSFEATFSFNRTGDYINQLGSSDYVFGGSSQGVPLLMTPNYNLQGRDIIDISVRQAILKKKGQLKFNISNLLGKPLIIYQDYNGNNKLDTPVIIDTRVGNIISGTDNISSMINGQASFSLAFSYTF
ncbi:MAG: TonB-dependent receptor [Ferruginibacter sp.]